MELTSKAALFDVAHLIVMQMVNTMYSFHGTDQSSANKIAAGQIDISQGAGELGQGFYTQTYYWEARAWAIHKYKHPNHKVVGIKVKDSDLFSLNLTTLSHLETVRIRTKIKRLNKTKSFKFNADMVWAPIVGSEKVTGDQYKWESITSEDHLNSDKTQKIIK